MLSSGSPVVFCNSNVVMQQQQTISGSGPFSSYGERAQMGLDVEFGSDPASGAFFQTDYKKHEDLKQMLDSNKDGLKLEAMKRIISMIARGRDASELFPAVVKNVVSKNIEVKKLVYVYLVRYAEEQQDLALLSISTFQRALKDPNQLIRASALRVLSSIRVSMIVPIVMLAIRDSAADMSPYVRKTAAHAIPKLYSLDPEQKEELVTVIEKLLSDRTTLVVGSAVMAFDEVCPERVDLIHKNYRKLCNLLVDVDEWGQVIIINMLTRYARTQFVNPNADEISDSSDSDKTDGENCNVQYGSQSSASNSDTDQDDKSKCPQTKKQSVPAATKRRNSSGSYSVDLDHRLLLRQAKPLLQSRNASVVMAVAQLYHHVAPRQEVQIIAKALIRLLRSHKEVQSVVLTCIASMSSKHKSIFEPHMKSFFVRTSDPTHIKLLKLDIITNLATAATTSIILREFQTYITNSDRNFVAATIQAIGRCAASIKEVTETCLSGLVHLLSNRDEHIVAESVVVIKKLLQTKAAEHFEIISQMAKLLDFINVPAARASIIWLIGEYNEKVPKIAPDVLRKMAKSFVDEKDVVKLQILNLGAKLYLTNPVQTSLLCQYVFTLARYDANYDIRDRARFLRQFIFPANGGETVLSKQAHKVFLTAKPAPALESKYRDRSQYQLGSLSHYLNQRAMGYNDLPAFPAVPPDASVRNVEGFMPENAAKSPQNSLGPYAAEKQDKSFFSDSNKSSSSYSCSDSSDEETSSASVGANNRRGIKSEATAQLVAAMANNVHESDTEDSDAESTSATSSSSSSSSTCAEIDSEHETEEHAAGKSPKKAINNNSSQQNGENSTTDTHGVSKKPNLDLLLDLDDIPPVGPVMTPSLGGFLTPGTGLLTQGLLPQSAANRVELVGPSFIEFKHKELLNKLSGHGLQVNYRFTRSPHLYSSSMVSIELQFNNFFNDDITNIEVGERTLPAGMQLNEFATIGLLQPLQTTTSVLGVDFNDSTHAIEFELKSSLGKSRISLKPAVGELVRSVQISECFFKDQRTQLRGMNEHQARLAIKRGEQITELKTLKQRIFECINVACVPCAENASEVLLFVGQTMSSKSLVLITLEWQQEEALLLTVNCEKMVIGSMVLSELKNALQALCK